MLRKDTGIDPMHAILMREHVVKTEVDGHSHYLYAPPWIENPGCNCAGARLPWWRRLLTALAIRRPPAPVCAGHSRPGGQGVSRIGMDDLIGAVLEHHRG